MNIKANPISDIISGITKNKCVGGSKHSTEYWENKGKLGREAFAHFGSASIRKRYGRVNIFKTYISKCI